MNSDKQTARDSGSFDTMHPTDQVSRKKPETEQDDMFAKPRRFELRAVAPFDPDF